MSSLKKWSSDDLIRHLRELDEAIKVIGYFTHSDLVMYHAVFNELERRGFNTHSVKSA